MEAFYHSCEDFLTYPRNLIATDILSHTLKAHHDRLDSRSSLLFDERTAAVDFWDLKRGEKDYQPTCIRDLDSMKQFLREALLRASSDPEIRYIFLSAPHSRAALRISAEMFKFLFSYHQVMPSFLDFVFPFGKQVLPQDAHFSGLRENSRLDDHVDSTGLAQLGRSDTALQLCYNLRSVEKSNDESLLPWSIRQAAVCHQFDVKTGTATWIMIKANKLIKNRLVESTQSSPHMRTSSRGEAFSATLSAHLLMCDWAGENWRWYFNDLEREFQKLTGGVFATQAKKDFVTSPISSPSLSMSPKSRTFSFPVLSSSTTTCNSPRGSPTPTVTRFIPGPFGRIFTAENQGSKSKSTPSTQGSNEICGSRRETRHDDVNASLATDVSGIRRSIMASLTKVQAWARHGKDERPSMISTVSPSSCPVPNQRFGPQEVPLENSEGGTGEHQDEFSFADLQRIQYIEEKAQETHLVIACNVQVLTDLRYYYRSLVNHDNFPIDVRRDCQRELSRFDRCILAVEKDLQMLQARIQNLLDRLANRKTLLNGILQHRSVNSSADFAKRAQQSADHMETMTIEMHEIAKKTKQETVSMRVITTVTLFFLPATFIATFMSTDILKFEHGEEDFQIKGLALYLAIALPLTVLTFVAWYIIYRVAKRESLRHQTEQSENMA